MRNYKALEKAIGIFICNPEDFEIEEFMDLLENNELHEDAIVWEPMERLSVEELKDQIVGLAQEFEWYAKEVNNN